MAFEKLEKNAVFSFCGIEFTKTSSVTAVSKNGKVIPFIKTVRVDI